MSYQNTLGHQGLLGSEIPDKGLWADLEARSPAGLPSKGHARRGHLGSNPTGPGWKRAQGGRDDCRPAAPHLQCPAVVIQKQELFLFFKEGTLPRMYL